VLAKVVLLGYFFSSLFCLALYQSASAATTNYSLFADYVHDVTPLPEASTELGVSASTSAAGQITAIRFYQFWNGTVGNNGAHTGYIWSGKPGDSSNTLLATKSFPLDPETPAASGWVQVALDAPISVAANEVFTVSVSNTNGFYTRDSSPSSKTVGPLSFLGTSYKWGADGNFPNINSGINYGIDFVFSVSTLPVNSSLPLITGNPVWGSQLTASPGSWDGASSYSYQWQSADTSDGTYADISGATSATYTPRGSVVGKFLRANVTATEGIGSATASSPPTTAVTNPYIFATVTEGQMLNLLAPVGFAFTGVVFASYGTPPDYSIGPCHAIDSQARVSAYMTKNSLAISADNNIFGDPCGGIGKRLSVVLSVTPVTDLTFPCNTGLYAVQYPRTLGTSNTPTTGGNIISSAGCTGEFALDASVTSISDGAFFGRTSITKVIFPEGLKSIGSIAFRETGLREITFPASIESVSQYSFDGMTAVESFTTYSSMDIPVAFLADQAIRSVSILGNVETINDWAFARSAFLTSITLPASLKNIGNHVFSNVTSLKNITFPASLQSIGANVFSLAPVENFTTYSNMPIATYSFLKSPTLQTVQILGNVEIISADAFNGATGLTTVTLPASLKTIGDAAFAGTTKLTQIIIPSGLVNLEANSFDSGRFTSIDYYGSNSGILEKLSTFMATGYAVNTLDPIAEAARVAAAAEAARVAEIARVAAAAEAARLAEIARVAAEIEAARLAEIARVAAQIEAARVAADAEDAKVKEAARLAAEAEAAKVAEAARLAAEAEAAKVAEAARVAAEAEAAKVKEAARLAAEAEAAKVAEAARISELARVAAAAEAEAKVKAAEEAQIKAQEEATLKAEAKIKADEEARLKAKEEAKAEPISEKEVVALVDQVIGDGKISSDDAEKIIDALAADGKVSDDEVDNLSAALAADGKFSEAEKTLVADALIQAAEGGAVTAENILSAGLTLQDLPPETPIEVRTDANGNEVVISAEVAIDVELITDPAAFAGELLSNPGAALQALGSIGADMSTEERKESTEAVVATVVAAGAAINAAAGAAIGAGGGYAGGGNSGGGNSGGGNSGGSSGSRRNEEW
jgi:flagellar biosynthesis GTPase FlhF